MKTQIIKEKDCEVVLEVNIPTENIRRELETADRKLLKSAKIKGFRKGKVPVDMVKKKFTEERNEAVIRSLIPETLESALKENNLNVIATPKISDLKYDFGKDISAVFKATVEVMPVFEVKKYKNFKVKKEIKEIKERDVKEVLDKLQQQNAKLVASASEIAEKEKYAVIDYQGYMDGKPAGGASGKGQLVDMRGDFISKDFINKITGMKKGEKRKLSVVFDDNYYKKDFAGKGIDFSVTLNEIKEKSLPAPDDELAKTMGFKSAEELLDSIRKNLVKNEEKKFDDSVRNEIIDSLIEWNPFPVPKSLVEEEYGYTLQYLKQSYGMKKLTENEEKELREKYYPVAEKRVRSALIFKKVIEKENIKAEEEDIKKEKKKIIEQKKYKADEIEKFFNKNINSIKEQILTEKLFDYFIENAKIKKKYVKSKPDDKMKLEEA